MQSSAQSTMAHVKLYAVQLLFHLTASSGAIKLLVFPVMELGSLISAWMVWSENIKPKSDSASPKKTTTFDIAR